MGSEARAHSRLCLPKSSSSSSNSGSSSGSSSNNGGSGGGGSSKSSKSSSSSSSESSCSIFITFHICLQQIQQIQQQQQQQQQQIGQRKWNGKTPHGKSAALLTCAMIIACLSRVHLHLTFPRVSIHPFIYY